MESPLDPLTQIEHLTSSRNFAEAILPGLDVDHINYKLQTQGGLQQRDQT